jgi:hypothetical protein
VIPQAMNNTGSQVAQVSRVGDQFHVTYSDGRPTAVVPILNRGRYKSRLRFRFTR